MYGQKKEITGICNRPGGALCKILKLIQLKVWNLCEMQLSKLTLKFRHFADVLKNGSRQEILSEKDFFQTLERERERANRNNQPFSLVVFDFRFFLPSHSTTKQFIKRITLRMRKIDEIGWYSQRQIGILLPYTNFQGAGIFVQSLKKSFGFTMPLINCAVFTYPDDNPNKNMNEDLRRTA